MQIDRHVSEMTCGSGGSAQNHAIHQRCAADPGAERQQNSIALSSCRAPECFRDQGGAGIIVGKEGRCSWLNHVPQQAPFKKK